MRLQAPKENVILDFTTIKTVKADLALGCDGAFSKVRAEMMKLFPGKVIQETFQHQYREFKVSASAALRPKEFLHIWPRKDLMMIALPNYDGSFTATLFCDFDKINSNTLEFFEKKVSSKIGTTIALTNSLQFKLIQLALIESSF